MMAQTEKMECMAELIASNGKELNLPYDKWLTPIQDALVRQHFVSTALRKIGSVLSSDIPIGKAFLIDEDGNRGPRQAEIYYCKTPKGTHLGIMRGPEQRHLTGISRPRD